MTFAINVVNTQCPFYEPVCPYEKREQSEITFDVFRWDHFRTGYVTKEDARNHGNTVKAPSKSPLFGSRFL